MELSFDITQEEMPVFLAETDEQLQVLDEGLIELEREGENIELLQGLFRAAHTLKGTSGMIGHKRMVTLTHALETALDGLRKEAFTTSTPFIDLCLEAVDALRLLREEVVQGKSSAVDVDALAKRFNNWVAEQSSSPESRPASAPEPVKEEKRVKKPEEPVKVEKEQAHQPEHGIKAIMVKAIISSRSIASAARALQIIMALEESGKILDMVPEQSVIETAKPIQKIRILVETDRTEEDIRKAVDAIAEIDQATISTLVGAKTLPIEEPITQIEGVEESPEAAAPVAAKPAVKETVAEVERQPGSLQNRPAMEKTLRTSVERLDNLMNLVGELITDRNRLYQIRNSFESKSAGEGEVDILSETVTHIGRITDQLQKEVMGIRMLPVSNVFNKFPRMIRDLANKFGKKLDLIMQGEDTELDRSVIEEITDPLIHLLRNSVDHGIETAEQRALTTKPERAKVLLTARHEQGRIILTVEDDGKGIDAEKVKASAISKGFITESEAAAMTEDEAINLIFTSGFSTAAKVSDISGRGVGLDIVKSNIQRLNGSIMIETWPGKGTRFQISLPLTLAIVPTLLVKVGANIFAIPLVTVLETLRIAITDIQTINTRPVIVLRNKVLPLINLSAAFDIPSSTKNEKYRYVVVVGAGKLQMGLVVDSLLGQEEVVVKSLGSLIGEIMGITSAAILGDGQVILIVDIHDLFRLAGLIHDR